MTKLPQVVEAYYSPADLSALWRFGPAKIRTMAKSGDFTVRDAAGAIVAEPMEVAGELRIPASGVNQYARSHALSVIHGVKARSKGELLRKITENAGVQG